MLSISCLIVLQDHVMLRENPTLPRFPAKDRAQAFESFNPHFKLAQTWVIFSSVDASCGCHRMS